MTFEDLLEQLQEFNPNELRKEVLVYDSVEEQYFTTSDEVCFVDSLQNNLNIGQPYLHF